MNIEEKDLATPVIELGDRLGYVHIGENDRGYLGSGHVDFRRFSAALADIDYRGPITFESFSSAVVARGLSNDLAIWRNLWDDGADLAGHARRYIVDGLRHARARQHPPGTEQQMTVDRQALESIALAEGDSQATVSPRDPRYRGQPGSGQIHACRIAGADRGDQGDSGSRMCPWTDFTSPTPSWTGSATATARVPPTPSTLRLCAPAGADRAGGHRPGLCAGVRPDARTTVGRCTGRVAVSASGDHRRQLPAAR